MTFPEIDMNKRLDEKLNKLINELLGCVGDVSYSPEQLDEKVNNDETLREYIRDTEAEFKLDTCDVDNMTGKELTEYVRQLDSLWEVC